MSWDERECFGLAQYAHKYVKYPRVRARRRPRGIYRRIPSKRAVGLTAWLTDASVAHTTDAASSIRRTSVCHVSTSFKIQRSSSNRRTRPTLARPGVCHTVRRGPERVKPRRAAMAATDAAQRPSLLCTEAALANWSTDADVSVRCSSNHASDACVQTAPKLGLPDRRQSQRLLPLVPVSVACISSRFRDFVAPLVFPFHIWAILSMCITLAHVLARETPRDYASKSRHWRKGK
jgi:hypothetical protein